MKKNHTPKQETKKQKIERSSQKSKQHTSPSISPTQASEACNTLATFDFDHFLSLPIDTEFDQLFTHSQQAPIPPTDDHAIVTTMPTYETPVAQNDVSYDNTNTESSLAPQMSDIQQLAQTDSYISSAALDQMLNTGLPSGTLPDDPHYNMDIANSRGVAQNMAVILDPTKLSEPLYFLNGKRLSRCVYACKLHDHYYIWETNGMHFLYTEKQLNELHPMHYKWKNQWIYIPMKETLKIREQYHASSHSIKYNYNLNNNIYILPIVTANDFLRFYPSNPRAKHLRRFKDVDNVLFANITPGDYFRAHANYVTIHGKRIAADALVLNLFGYHCVIDQVYTHVIYDQAYWKGLQPLHYKILNQTYHLTQEQVNAGVITESIRPEGPERLITYVSPAGVRSDLPVFFKTRVKSMRYTALTSELKDAKPLALVTASTQLSEVNTAQNLAPFSIFTTSITTASTATSASNTATATNDASLSEENPSVEQIYKKIGFDQ